MICIGMEDDHKTGGLKNSLCTATPIGPCFQNRRQDQNPI